MRFGLRLPVCVGFPAALILETAQHVGIGGEPFGKQSYDKLLKGKRQSGVLTAHPLKCFGGKPSGKILKISYRMKGQLGAFQIDGFGDPEMEEIAGLLKNRAREFSIEFVDAGDGASARPEES